MRKIARVFSLLLPYLLLAFPLTSETEPDIQTVVSIDGIKTRVFFNDGDTFKILDGDLKNGRVRIEGMNTLESYGPVHEWKQNDTRELFDVANLATTTARTGTWSCKLEKEKDTYGRLLAICDDLALALIGKGLAHAYSIDTSPADANYLQAQKEAQSSRLGMWKEGVPKFIITSLHSVLEGKQKAQRKTYNRKIDTADGHSEQEAHEKAYATCEKVCLEQDNSCMVYVPFEIRYGKKRPECLRGNQ